MNLHHTIAPLILSLSAVRVPSCSSEASADYLLSRAETAMGSSALHTLEYSAVGSAYTFGQAYTPTSPWPKVNVHSMTRTLNYDSASLREQVEISRAEPLGGGAYPASAKQKNDQFVSGNYAWNMSGTTVVPFSFFLSARINQLWVTPHGIIKAAQRSNAVAKLELRDGKAREVVSFREPGTLSAKLYLDDTYHVTRVESRVPDNVLGETNIVTEYSDYQNFSGVEFPTKIVQTQEGQPLTELTVTAVTPNAPAEILVPDAVVNFQEKVTSTQVAEGVWFVSGGSHNSVVIEMHDHVVVVETPLNDQRSQPVLAEAQRLVPNKPVKCVVNSHPHFDHAGGMRAAVASGATIVTHEGNAAYYERAFNTPNTLRPDALALSGKSATVLGVPDDYVLSDGTRTVELHRILGSSHADTMLMAYLPAEKILIEADLFTPGSNPNAPTPAVLESAEGLVGRQHRALGAQHRADSAAPRPSRVDDGAAHRGGQDADGALNHHSTSPAEIPTCQRSLVSPSVSRSCGVTWNASRSSAVYGRWRSGWARYSTA
ncbi:MAG: MBL fold metallo-hydrolase [Polyangiaceae bacterium]